MADTRIEAVVFDLDGVITDTARFHYAAWKQLAGQLGITIDEAFNERLKGVSRMDSLEEILREGGQQDRFSLEEKEQLASEKNEQYCRLLTQLTPEDVLPGIPEFIASIKAAGIPVGLASVSRNAGTVLESLQLGPVFDYIADAALIRNSKPDPEIFLTACAGLGADPAIQSESRMLRQASRRSTPAGCSPSVSGSSCQEPTTWSSRQTSCAGRRSGIAFSRPCCRKCNTSKPDLTGAGLFVLQQDVE